MTWPTVDVVTTNTDADTKVPLNARPDILDLMQKFNQLKGHVTAYMQGLLADADAATTRGGLGSGVTGDALFLAATAASARTTLGSTVVGDALFITASAAAARTTLGSTAVGDAVFITASAVAARATLGLHEGVSTGTIVDAKGDLIAATADNVPARKAVGTDGQVLAADSAQTTGLVYVDNPSRPNLLVNPNWQIDQINEGTLYTVSAATIQGPDGWSGLAAGSGTFKLRTLADPDNAALKCLEITCTTASAAIAAADDYYLFTNVEGYDAAALMAGTASALAVTVQFKFKTNVNGVYGISLINGASNRRYVGIITVANANENEYVVTLTMDTAGTWLYTNGTGLALRLCLAAGTNFQAAAGAWAAGAEQTTSAQCNFMSAITNVAYLKRVQLIPGALVQAYRPADIPKELAKTQRYYWKTFPQGTAPVQNVGNSIGAIKSDFAYANAAGCVGIADFPTVMRTAPTVVTLAPDAATVNWSGAVNRTMGIVSDRGFHLQADTNTGAGNAYTIHATANSRLS
jgi:hypothetical protein